MSAQKALQDTSRFLKLFDGDFLELQDIAARTQELTASFAVEQQFGLFPTWTQAQNFATKLNEGLSLDPLEVRQIVTSSLLATACVIQEALSSGHLWPGSEIEREAHAAHLRLVLGDSAQLETVLRHAHEVQEALQAPARLLGSSG